MAARGGLPMQFAWRAPRMGDPYPEGSVLTCEAQLLLGSIGSKLEVVHPGKEVISTVGWSPDGSMAAVGCKDCVKVWHAHSCQDFTVKVGSQVSAPLPAPASVQLPHPIQARLKTRLGLLIGSFQGF